MKRPAWQRTGRKNIKCLTVQFTAEWQAAAKTNCCFFRDFLVTNNVAIFRQNTGIFPSCQVKSWGLEATPSVAPIFKKSYKISNLLQLQSILHRLQYDSKLKLSRIIIAKNVISDIKDQYCKGFILKVRFGNKATKLCKASENVYNPGCWIFLSNLLNCFRPA